MALTLAILLLPRRVWLPIRSWGRVIIVVFSLSLRTVTYFLAGDASYTQELMLQKQVDGVSNDQVTARQTLERVYRYCYTTPTVYLPSHDPDALDRLANRQLVAPMSPPVALMIEADSDPQLSSLAVSPPFWHEIQ